MKDFESMFLDFCINSGKGYGLDVISSKLFGIVFIEPSEVSLEELSKRTKYSLATVSNKMRFLQNFGMVKRIKKPGSKKVYYYMEKDIIKLTLMHLQKMQEAEILPAKEMIPDMIKGVDIKKLDETKKKKFEIIKNYYKNILIIDKHMKHMIEELRNVK